MECYRKTSTVTINSFKMNQVLDDEQRGNKKINERFADLVANPYRSDFKFIIEDDDGVVIPAHKFIVGAGSLVLDRIVYGTSASESVDSTVVDQISAAAFIEILRYLYTDEANITDQNAIEIMCKASYYDILLLESKCIDVLLESINRKNCFTFYSKLFTFYSYTSVVKKCLEFIQFAPNCIFSHADFPDLDLAALKEILKNDVINSSEYELYDALLQWANANCMLRELTPTVENKREVMQDGLKLIRFTTLTAEEFSNCLNLAPGLLSVEEINEIQKAISTKKPKELKRQYLTCQGKIVEAVINIIIHKFKQIIVILDTTWIARSYEDELPPDAVYVGFHNNGNPIYLGRSYYVDGIHPVEIIPHQQAMYYYCDDMRREVEYFDVLCGSGYEWVKVTNGKIPNGAVVASNDSEEFPLYIGRASVYDKFLTLGRIDLENRCIFVCDFNDDFDHEVADFEVLVGRKVEPRRMYCELYNNCTTNPIDYIFLLQF